MDEPVLDRDKHPDQPTAEVEGRLRDLINEQHYGVLCTQGAGQPYGSVVAYACSPALDRIWFATPETTRKFKLIQGCPKVALVIYRDQGADVMSGAAVTITGEATILDATRDAGVAQLLSRHPHLETFCAAPTTAVIRLDIVRCFYVERFQEVTEWSP